MTEALHNDLLVVSVRLNGYDVRRFLMDIGSSVNLLILDVYSKLSLDKTKLMKVSYLLVGLGDKTVTVLGTVNLPLVVRDKKHKREV